MIINIYKPVGWTSFDVVKRVRGITNEKRVGHGGTLDPFAEGVLIIGTGKDTKKLTDISSDYKSYIATLTLGEETNTLDIEGEIVKESDVPKLSIENINNVLTEFLGKQTQIPPMFSAKKVGGKKLYELARKNIEIDREPKEIEIKEIDLLDFVDNKIIFHVTSSKGTYIRVLGSDIAKALGTVGHLTKLVRQSVGKFVVEEAITIEEFEIQWKNISV
ncbi:MAG: tRNA pseudouridine(55) synthase TruB [Planctomycetia bacterium]|nr:tRNA pseudouridine(55) synthase TruB [Planctomycetia bacterium]